MTKKSFDAYLKRVFDVNPKDWPKGRLLYNEETLEVTDPRGKLIAFVSKAAMKEFKKEFRKLTRKCQKRT